MHGAFSEHFGVGGKEQFLKQIAQASLASRTPVNVFMDMSIQRFIDFTAAIAQTLHEMRTKE